MVFVLLIVKHEGETVSTGVGPVFFNRIDAARAAKSAPFNGLDVTVSVLEREVRGDIPNPVTFKLGTPEPAFPPPTVPERERREIPPFSEDR